MEKKLVITLKLQMLDGTENDLQLLANVEKIYEQVRRYYIHEGTPIAYRLSFPTPKFSADDTENTIVLDSLDKVIIGSWTHTVLSVQYTNNRTIIEVKAYV